MSHNSQPERARAPDEPLPQRQLSDSPLIYLAAPFSHTNPDVSRWRLEEVNRYAANLLSQGRLAFSPLSHGAQLDSPDIPDSVWYELGLRIMESCDELWLLALDGWEGSEGVRMELERAWELDIPVYIVNPDTYEALRKSIRVLTLS